MAPCVGCGKDLPPGVSFCPSCGTPVASTCPSCGSAVEPDHRFCPVCGHRLSAGTPEERKLVTALFVDLVGSTSLGERLDPEVLRLVLSRYFDEMTEVVESWGGSVAKYVGDAVLAVFGLPRSHGDDADRALHAALGMAARLAELNEVFEQEHGIRLRTRAGVNTGEVVASDIDQVVLGDVMNTAARLEQAAAEGTTLVGSRTVANLTTRFRLEPVDSVEAKGKSAPVDAHRLVGGPVSAARPTADRVIGRSRELAVLSTEFDQVVSSGRPFLVTLIGDAGIGKSTLSGAFGARCTEQGALVVSAGCLPYGEGIGAWPLREIIRDLAGIGLDDDSAAAAVKFRAFVRSVSDEDALLNALAVSAGIALDDNPLARAPADAVRRALSVAWPDLLTALSVTAPVVVIVEDVHWADEDLVSVLERIVLRTAGPVMVVCTARPDFDEGRFGSRTPRSRVTVAPLDDQERSALATRLLPGLPPADAADIVDAAGGNPLFMEEIVAHLVDTGRLRVVDGRMERIGSTAPGDVPDTVRSLLGARIDALDPEPKEMLSAAAVMGSMFWLEAVAEMVDAADPDGAFDTLEAEGLVVPDRDGRLPGFRHAAFRHDLVREVAYGSVSRARAARHHAWVADWMERTVGDRRNEFIDLITHHRARAAEERLLGWPNDDAMRDHIRLGALTDLLDASVVALRRSATDEALRLLERAADLAVSASERGRISLARARVYRESDRFTEAWIEYKDLLDFATGNGLSDLEADAVIEGAVMTAQMGGAIHSSHDWQAWLRALVEDHLEPARRSGKTEESAALLAAQASLMFWSVGSPDPEAALEAARESVDLARQCRSIRVSGPATDLLAGINLLARGLGAALAEVDDVLETADQTPDRRLANELYTTTQWALTAAGQLDRSRMVGARHAAEAQMLGTHSRIHALRGVVELALAACDLPAILAATEDLLELITEDGGQVCDHGSAAVSARALALCEAGSEEGPPLFEHLVEIAAPKAQFTAYMTLLEQQRPFLDVSEAAERLQNLMSDGYLWRAVARCWIALPVAVRLGDRSEIEASTRTARRLATDSDDPALSTLADWGAALLEDLADPDARGRRTREACERMVDYGRAYTGLRLAVDAAYMLDFPADWTAGIAARLEAGSAFHSAEELRALA